MDKFKPTLPVPEGVLDGQVVPPKVSVPLREEAAADILELGRYRCAACDAPVDEFLSNEALRAARPEAINAALDTWHGDWFLACSNTQCIHAWGEGWSQSDFPEWALPVRHDRDPVDEQRDRDAGG